MDEGDPTKVDKPSAQPQAPRALEDRLSRYRIEAVIGRGGMGEVLSARDEEIGRSVAIKQLHSEEPSSMQITRFMREAQIQGQLEHPAIVPVHELARDPQGRPYFVMKLLAGTTLREVLKKPEVTTRQRLLRAFADVCLAIELAHTRGVIHRDLKPSNIMLGDFGEVYVLDWGIAKLVDDIETPSAPQLLAGGDATQAGSILGTPGYMAPEQMRGEQKLDARVDVYALGCILREILDATPEDIPELRSAVTAATAEKDTRIASARALGEIVQRYLDGDRDMALRRDLAKTELATARDAFAKSEQRTAIAAAGRALALDPTLREAAELLGRLMLEPPDPPPPEVERELRARDASEIVAQSTLGTWASASYFLFIPILYFSGFSEPFQIVTATLLTVVACVLIYMLRFRPTTGFTLVTLIANVVLLAWIGYLITPFLLTPAVALFIAAAYASQPRTSTRLVIYGLVIVGLLAPLTISLSIDIEGSRVVLQSAAAKLEKLPTLGGIILFMFTSLASATYLMRAMAIQRRDMQRALHIQAWQLRQLVPESPPSI